MTKLKGNTLISLNIWLKSTVDTIIIFEKIQKFIPQLVPLQQLTTNVYQHASSSTTTEVATTLTTTSSATTTTAPTTASAPAASSSSTNSAPTHNKQNGPSTYQTTHSVQPKHHF